MTRVFPGACQVQDPPRTLRYQPVFSGCQTVLVEADSLGSGGNDDSKPTKMQ